MSSRISRDEMLMQFAKLAAQRGTCRRSQVGAIIARDGRVISHGYVGSPPGFPHCIETGCVEEDGHCIRTSHAEMNALLFAAKHGIKTENTELYSTHSPCFTCAKAIITAGIRRVVYSELYEDAVATHEQIEQMFRKADIRYESRYISPTPTEAS